MPCPVGTVTSAENAASRNPAAACADAGIARHAARVPADASERARKVLREVRGMVGFTPHPLRKASGKFRRARAAHYFFTAPNTCFSKSDVRAAGFSRMRFSSSATTLNKPSIALPAT